MMTVFLASDAPCPQGRTAFRTYRTLFGLPSRAGMQASKTHSGYSAPREMATLFTMAKRRCPSLS